MNRARVIQYRAAHTLAFVLAAAAHGGIAHGQDSVTTTRVAPARLVYSMGQPPVWQYYADGFGATSRRIDGVAGGALAGVYRPVLNSVTGLFGLSAEGYAITGDGGAGARLLGTTRALGLSAGADWDARHSRIDFVLSYRTAVRRGGLLGHGTMLRLDWLPTRARYLSVGVDVPLNRPFAGRTRPRDTDVDLPIARDEPGPRASILPAAAEGALATVSEAATLIRAYNNLYSDENEAVILETVRRYRVPSPALRLLYGLTYNGVVRAYAEALAGAFGSAANSAALGDPIARRARAGVLTDVVLPFDSLFGQVKEGPGLRGLTSIAQRNFTRWLRDSSRVDSATWNTVLAVHARWLGVLERVHDDLQHEWKDSRLVWLPLQLALVPEQYDEQSEVDDLVSRVVGRPFTDGNALTYLRSIDLPLEIARSIYSARDYHVLWVHDFRGRTDAGTVDDIGYSMVADAYLPALTESVKRYDSTGRIPAYVMFLDQFYNETTDAKLWLRILEDPLRARIHLPGANATREAHLRARQEELRAAVAASARLSRDAARNGGDPWLRRLVKVHVNITQPSDFSFRSHQSLPGIPFTPDNAWRDHRKIAFYDLNEADPYRGGVLVMGVGIGEHYASATWEDRGYRLRGPAALEVRAAARRLLHLNGFGDGDIPEPLRPVASAPAVEQRMDQELNVGRAIQLHNEPGFGPKQSSVVRAMMYNLAPPGSILIAPDALWLSESWAAMLAGAAARGGRVVIVAPSKANGPNPQKTVLAREHDVIARLLRIRAALADQLKEARGEIHVGLFTARAQSNDAEGVRREIRDGLVRSPWIRELVPFDAGAVAVLERAVTQTAASGEDATAIARDVEVRPPLLHQKTQLIARPGAMQALVRQPGWEDVLARSIRVQSRQSAQVFEQLDRRTPEVADTSIRSTDAIVRSFEQTLPEAERKRVSFYFTLGTQNQDPRGLMQDGEAAIVVSGVQAAAGLVDLYFLMARSTFIETPAELDRLVPPQSWLIRKLARLIRSAL